MRAVVYAGEGAVTLQEVPAPALREPTDAIVRVTLSGICGTDLHVIGGPMAGVVPGTVLGHEFVGDVVEVGGAVHRLRVGQHVMASDFTACGHCRWCDRGDHWHCAERGFFGTGTAFGAPIPGAQAELVRVPHAETTLCPVPPGCSDEACLLIGDNLATGWVAVERAALTPGETAVIIGGGTIGQLVSLSAQAAGAGYVLVIEPNEERRRFAQRHGALAVAPDGAKDRIAALTGGDGADVVIDAVGGNSIMDAALRYARKRGRIVSVGVPHEPGWMLPIGACFADETSLSFAIGDSIRVRERLARLVAAGVIDPTVVIQSRVPLDAAADAYRALAAQTVLKIVMEVRPGA